MINKFKKIVIKIGSSSIVNKETKKIKASWLKSICSDIEYIYPNKKNIDLLKQLSNSEYTILGHTHHPFVWCNENRWLINPGSVGQPRDQSALSSFFYLDLKNKTLLPRKVKFPLEKLFQEILKNDPNNKYLKSVFTRGQK